MLIMKIYVEVKRLGAFRVLESMFVHSNVVVPT